MRLSFTAWLSSALGLARVRSTGGASTADTTTAGIKNWEKRIGAWQGDNFLEVSRFLVETFRRFQEFFLVNAPVTASAIAVLRNLDAKGVGAEMGNLAEKIDR